MISRAPFFFRGLRPPDGRFNDPQNTTFYRELTEMCKPKYVSTCPNWQLAREVFVIKSFHKEGEAERTGIKLQKLAQDRIASKSTLVH